MLKPRLLDLERLALSREDAMEHYAKQAEERKRKCNANLSPKIIIEGSLAFYTTTIGLITIRLIGLCQTGKVHSKW